MKKKRIARVLCLFLCMLVTITAIAADVTITPKRDMVYVAVGKTADVRVELAPRAARAKGVTFQSDDETIATVNDRGRVTGVAAGNCNIVVTSKYDESTSIKVPVSVIVQAKSITVTAENTAIAVGDTATLSLAFAPEDASVKQATYQSTNKRIATVDENGVVTGVKAGKVSIVASATDGSNTRGKINLTIVQPITGISVKTPHVRVGVNRHGTVSANIQPKNATNRAMTWESSDPGVATVSGGKNSVRIQGRRWGQATITGTTEDGGYQVRFEADIGSLRQAVTVQKLRIKDGKPYIVLKNNSNLNITQVRYQIKGYDAKNQPIQMSRKQNTLKGTYELALAPGEVTEHGMFNFIQKIKYTGLTVYELAITGWSTDTGYYNSKGELLYDYNVSPRNYEWWDTTEFK